MKKFLSSVLALALVLSLVVFGSVLVSAEETTNAAKIGDTEYATLALAVKAVEKNTTATPTTITLLKDQSISSLMVGHQYPQNIIVDLNGYTLSSNAIVLTAYRNGTTLTVKNGTICGNSTSGTLRATYGGKLVLGDNLTVKGAGGSATLVYVDNGSVEIAAENGVAFTGGKLDFKQSTNVNNVISVAASIGRTYFCNLTDALAAATDGDTVTLQDNATLENTVLTINKDLTIDFNGHTVTGKFGETTTNSEVNGSLKTAVTQFVLIENANVTLKDSSEAGEGGLNAIAEEYGNLSNLIRVATTGKLTIESGNYHQNLSVVGAGMIDSRGSDNITVMGGNFELDNVGTQSNGSPWIFNTSGRNSGHINVEGGTFNADVFHQYYVFEVQVPDELQGTLALKHENGKYTVVDAVAYVVEKHGNYEMKVGYVTLEEAFAACDVTDGKVAYRTGTYYASQQSEGENVVLRQDINLGGSIVIS